LKIDWPIFNFEVSNFSDQAGSGRILVKIWPKMAQKWGIFGQILARI